MKMTKWIFEIIDNSNSYATFSIFFLITYNSNRWFDSLRLFFSDKKYSWCNWRYILSSMLNARELCLLSKIILKRALTKSITLKTFKWMIFLTDSRFFMKSHSVKLIEILYWCDKKFDTRKIQLMWSCSWKRVALTIKSRVMNNLDSLSQAKIVRQCSRFD